MGTIRCPKCRKMIDEKDKKCGYCGFNGISSYISSLKRIEKRIQKKKNNKWKKSIYNAIESKGENENCIPKCPTCSSTNIKEIGSANKTVSIALFGIFSSKIGKQFQCSNCGYKW